MRINKYRELYKAYLNLLVDLHNANIDFERKQTQRATRELRRVLSDMRRVTVPLRDEIILLHREMKAEQQARWAEKNKQKGKPNE